MIKKVDDGKVVQFYSDVTDIRGKIEVLAFVTMFTLKHVILTASDSWIKHTIKDGHTYYYAEFFGKNYEHAKAEDIDEYNRTNNA